jgi:hypothetical protein
MKNIAFAAGLCLLVFASCKKTSDTDETLAISKEKTLSVCTYDPDLLLANLKRRKPTPTTDPTTTPTTDPTPTPTPTAPTGTGYSCILIDFDGQTVSNAYWNNGATFNCAASGLSSAQISEVITEVNALYAGYNVVITYDENVYNAANPMKRTRVIVTPTSSWYPAGSSGVAYIGSITWGDQTPAFVFSDRLYYTSHYVAEIVAHEAGHTIGLRHQSEYDASCNLVSTYKNGAVMGNSLNSTLGQWIYGTTSSCTTFQDDNSVLSGLLGVL